MSDQVSFRDSIPQVINNNKAVWSDITSHLYAGFNKDSFPSQDFSANNTGHHDSDFRISSGPADASDFMYKPPIICDPPQTNPFGPDGRVNPLEAAPSKLPPDNPIWHDKGPIPGPITDPPGPDYQTASDAPAKGGAGTGTVEVCGPDGCVPAESAHLEVCGPDGCMPADLGPNPPTVYNPVLSALFKGLSPLPSLELTGK